MSTRAGARAHYDSLWRAGDVALQFEFEFQNKMGINVCSAETLRFRRKERGPFYSHNARVRGSGE